LNQRNDAFLATQEDDVSPDRIAKSVPEQPKAPKGLKILSINEAMKIDV